MNRAWLILIPALFSIAFFTAFMAACAKQGVVSETTEVQYEDAVAQTMPEDGRILTEAPAKPDKSAKYFFYLHGRILEESGIDAVSPEFGKYEYTDILETIADRGFIVISEVRKKNTDVKQYAQKVADQVNSLLKAGVPAGSITIAGASKGGAIAHRASSVLKNKDLNIIMLAACGEGYHDGFDIDLTGNVLSIYDYKDDKGAGSCADFFSKSKNINRHKEIELKLGLGHGILYKPLEEWVEPTIAWAGGTY